MLLVKNFIYISQLWLNLIFNDSIDANFPYSLITNMQEFSDAEVGGIYRAVCTRVFVAVPQNDDEIISLIPHSFTCHKFSIPELDHAGSL